MKAYPASWRHANEDEALGVLLDVAEAEASRGGGARVDARQAASLVLNGLGARLELALPARWRALAAASVMVGTTGFALVDLIFFEWQPWAQTPVYPHAGVLWPLAPFSTPQVVVVIGWLLAVLMRATGQRIAGRVLFAATGAAAVTLAWFAMHPVLIGSDAPYFSVTPQHVLAAFLAPVADPSVGSTLAVFIVGSIVVLCGDADRALRPTRQLLGAVGAGAAIILLWWAQGTGTTLPINAYRRVDDDLWRGWLEPYLRTTSVDVWAVVFLFAVAVAIGLGLRRTAATLIAVLGPLFVVWVVYYVLFHEWLRRFADPLAPLGGWPLFVQLSVTIGGPLLAWAAARRARPLGAIVAERFSALRAR